MHQYGIQCVVGDDWPGMIATGWTIWKTAGIHAFQAFDFMSDGYKLWSEQAPDERELQVAFLAELFDGLDERDPPVPADIWAAPREQVEPASVHCQARCWAGSELIEVFAHQSNGDAPSERRIYEAMARTHRDFVPPRSINWASHYARDHGLSDPW